MTEHIPNTPEEMFPKEFDVVTTEDAAIDMLRSGSPIDAYELLCGPIEESARGSMGRQFDNMTTVEMDTEIIQKLDKEAEIMYTSRNAIIRHMIAEGLVKRDQKRNKDLT